MSTAVRASCFDTSALLKLYVDEPGSRVLRAYWDREATRFTTSFCIYETLSQLKASYFKRGKIDQDTYYRACTSLCAWFDGTSMQSREPALLSANVFFKTLSIAEKYDLDLSDAFQILCLRDGFFSHMCAESKTVLVSADSQLVSAARAEGLRAWDLKDEEPP